MEMFPLFSVQIKGVKTVAVLPLPHAVNTLTRSPNPDFDINAAASYRGWSSLWQPPAGSPVNHSTAGRQINPNIHILTATEATGIFSPFA